MKYTLTITIITLLLFTNCASKKKFVYFQDNTDTKFSSYNKVLLKTGDILSIKIFGCDEENLKIFNIPTLNEQNINRSYFSGGSVTNGYLIDKNGNIDFPMIGEIKLSDLSVEEANQLIKLKLNNFLKDPKVNIHIQNFKITILGDLRNPGTIEVPNEKITLVEAIGIAGDLNITARRDNILVLRDENSMIKKYRVDITKSDFMNSSVYYLQQNDIIYIEANKPKINSSKVTGTSSVFVAIASLIITTVNLILK
jgi:polysaccharide export outer membrane protein